MQSNTSGQDEADTSTNKAVLKVAVSGPFLTPLDYLDCDNLTETPEMWPRLIGRRVEIPFRNRSLIAIVVAVAPADYALEKIKTILRWIDEEPILHPQDLTFLQWVSDYYHAPMGEVINTALPKRIRGGEEASIHGHDVWTITALGREQLQNLPAKAKAKRALAEQFLTCETPLNREICKAQTASWRKFVNEWLDLGWVSQTSGPCWQEAVAVPGPQHALNSEQQSAVDQVVSHVRSGDGFASFLLQGITGSGKTEVYLAMVEHVLEMGRQVLILVPEIGLTPQMIQRFSAHLQRPIALMHSAMNDTQRHCAWHSVRSGEVSVLMGTRSAVFAPFKDLGLCIIDEEHDTSYKQQDGVRYSARDILVRRAHQLQVPIVLGSATPSLESLFNVDQQRYRLLTLNRRAGTAKPPKIRLIDIRGEKIQEGVGAKLKAAMQKHLQAGQQVLLFLNRRGFAPVLMCHECGWQAQCPSCDANMTLHQGSYHQYLLCHHCGEQMNLPESCPQCGSEELHTVGQGTERLEETIVEWFPEKTVLRIDRDSTRLKGKMEELTQQAQKGEADILIGTQMLAKGHHFPKVTLVGLLDIDQGLFSCDYRATERMAQLLLQVAGRAGRAEDEGEVLVQTHHPQHPLLLKLINEGYGAFAEAALAERKEAHLPPWRFQCLVRCEAHNAQDALDFLNSLKAGLELQWQTLQQESADTVLELWGPVSAPMMRRQGRYRYQLMLASDSRPKLHQLLTLMLPHIYQSPLARKVRWNLDIDPQDMY
ncbi:primosomal protein N' [Thiomicrorhabdus xiamenensis]|uniref:Replication restart protein PriA n=1 Tax=Thiomicrorhabdus xiamenensis TaxID=2739063 RepID=A0A7D4NJG9_9GAMM|nr:primosomal protein N' [Thiomicrorhabdus xiamenensis]QKI88229.1 primosomal protein N' [Thiomicrorhabdus xiamenensis]